jgi:hypothetical protein
MIAERELERFVKDGGNPIAQQPKEVRTNDGTLEKNTTRHPQDVANSEKGNK